MNLQDLYEEFKLDIIKKQIPQYFFKYRTLEAFEKILDNNSLWFSNPQEFNDPFDCQIMPDSNNTSEEIETFIRRSVPALSAESKIKQSVEYIINTPGLWKEILNTSMENMIASIGVCCFAGNYKNLLMWSHYGDSHKGVCLKFDALKDITFFSFPYPINYQFEYPYYNHLQNREDIVKTLILTKSDNWKYEEEFRVIKTNEVGLHPFEKQALIEIIFGCKCTDEEIDKYIELTKQRDFNVKFKKAIKKDREYGLDFVEVN